MPYFRALDLNAYTDLDGLGAQHLLRAVHQFASIVSRGLVQRFVGNDDQKMETLRATVGGGGMRGTAKSGSTTNQEST